jgi:hypothetical protein
MNTLLSVGEGLIATVIAVIGSVFTYTAIGELSMPAFWL